MSTRFVFSLSSDYKCFLRIKAPEPLNLHIEAKDKRHTFVQGLHAFVCAPPVEAKGLGGMFKFSPPSII
ncbi:hypothetical protein L3X38_012084 [Prunus dulcis]|uniref:Uncharacterized protein n=1 Tax=Prunus dulcis TaxID=3755 RepID=A0AAD4WLF5_PRUDU|nr:hypothetical protein L3X38_012084 [Prunus dulcis]